MSLIEIKGILFSVTRELDGTINFYIWDLDTTPVLSGSADQNSGTINVIIGNNSG